MISKLTTSPETHATRSRNTFDKSFSGQVEFVLSFEHIIYINIFIINTLLYNEVLFYFNFKFSILNK